MVRSTKSYDGDRPNAKPISALLDPLLKEISSRAAQRPDLIVAAWHDLIGPKMAPMTEAQRFEEGVLHVKVKNSSLFALLEQHEKPKLLKALRVKFPEVVIQKIVFRMG